ncbi:alpha/beta hydrolase [Streptomyces sp. NPDC048441]|uniref:alpha/beta hydrolase n=1 Tax=Streptomyces sp. NPDC048441 TaxID=3365552 RepID=UPI003711C4C3
MHSWPEALTGNRQGLRLLRGRSGAVHFSPADGRSGRDPRTAHKGAVALHGLLPSSKLITVKGANRHAIYGLYENACVDQTIRSTVTRPPASCPPTT